MKRRFGKGVTRPRPTRAKSASDPRPSAWAEHGQDSSMTAPRKKRPRRLACPVAWTKQQTGLPLAEREVYVGEWSLTCSPEGAATAAAASWGSTKDRSAFPRRG